MQAAEIKDFAVDATKRVISQIRDEDSALNHVRDNLRNADAKVREMTRSQPILCVMVAIVAGYAAGRTLAKIS